MSVTIVEDILSCLRDELHLASIRISRVCLGWGFTAVQVSTGDVGLCHSLLEEIAPTCCQIVQRAGTLSGSPVTHLTELAKSWDIGERVIGFATINALSQIIIKREQQRYAVREGNILDEIDIRPTETVGMVGNIKPLVPTIRNKTSKLWIFERGQSFDDSVLPDTACEELLPKADIVIITGSAIANGTIGRLLQLSENARTVGIVGPTASIVPDPLFRRGVDIIGGVIVTNPERAMQIVAEGGGTPQLKAATKFIIIKPKRVEED